MTRNIPKPWRDVVRPRGDLKSGELSLAMFAADLHDVAARRGLRPTYEDPAEFFALTYPTLNLRELARGVALRLAGRSDKACRTLSVDYGGGKTHTLITLLHLARDPDALPRLPAVEEFTAHIGFAPPKARTAALCFDKIDLEKGIETPDPGGAARALKHPWSILAWQLAGADGLRAIHADGADAERDTPPAQPLLESLLSAPRRDGLATLVLLDEVLMFLRARVEADSAWRGRLLAFFQALTQAAVKVDGCAVVASLLASDPRRNDDLGAALFAELSNVFSRQTEEAASPVGKADVAEVLRRRFFEPESISDPAAFRPHVAAAVGAIARLDEETRKQRRAAEARYLASYPFHPDLTEAFYARWTQVEGFQSARGILRTFAIALRDAAEWDASPLVGANVFLAAPGKPGLSEAARELCLAASVDADEGGARQWAPIVEGELDKARAVQSEAAGLRHREVEQAVVGVFLNSQPVGGKLSTRGLLALLGAGGPDRIELEKALLRWSDLSWFLDEAEAAPGEAGPGGERAPPKAWRLGNRPNLRQMHHDACAQRVSPQLVDQQLVDGVRDLKSLTQGATAAGARVHKLPQGPGDVQDDGEFHYAVLGPEAASESGKPSALARRFADETTGPDRPRANRNAVVLAVPSRDGLDAARARVRAHLGWVEVAAQLKGQPIDPVRRGLLQRETEAARKAVPEAIRQAWTVVVTVDETNSVHAFKATVGGGPLFATIAADRRARIQAAAIAADAMTPGGPYDLWREGEDSRRVGELVGAFARWPRLPKMPRRKDVLATVAAGVRDGIWVARRPRPDRSFKTFWRTGVDDEALADPALEIALPESAVLSDIAPELLAPGTLPELWPGGEIAARDVVDYFSGGRRATVPRDGYDDTAVIPKCEPPAVEAAIAQAVERGVLWLRYGASSLCGEPVPRGALAPAAALRPPPAPIAESELGADSLPDAWKDGRSTARAIADGLSARRGEPLPWPVVRSALESAIDRRWLELADDGAPWPCAFAEADRVALRPPGENGGGFAERDTLVAAAMLPADRVQDLGEQIPALVKAAVGHDLKFHLRVEFGGKTPPEPDAAQRIAELLAQVSDDLKLR